MGRSWFPSASGCSCTLCESTRSSQPPRRNFATCSALRSCTHPSRSEHAPSLCCAVCEGGAASVWGGAEAHRSAGGRRRSRTRECSNFSRALARLCWLPSSPSSAPPSSSSSCVGSLRREDRTPPSRSRSSAACHCQTANCSSPTTPRCPSRDSSAHSRRLRNHQTRWLSSSSPSPRPICSAGSREGRKSTSTRFSMLPCLPSARRRRKSAPSCCAPSTHSTRTGTGCSPLLSLESSAVPSTRARVSRRSNSSF
mmetsp:Transcript_2754/g.6686  ORF Transcript_2754/g.6686 Transcript_2754/m.6686 type:complete len:254 (+) Transcript_2754:1224-1985(+)